MLIPLWWYISHHNEYTNDVLYTGWTPIIGAMIISRQVSDLMMDISIGVSVKGVASLFFGVSWRPVL